MAHKIFVKDTVTGQCGLATPVCPVSADAGNLVDAGSDGGAFLDCASLAGCGFVTSSGVTQVQSTTPVIPITNPAGPVVSVGFNPTQAVTAICSTPAAKTALLACVDLPPPAFGYTSPASQSVPSGANTILTNATNGGLENTSPGTTYSAGTLTIGAQDAGFWHINAEASFVFLGTTGVFRVAIVINGIAAPYVSGEKALGGSATHNRQKILARRLNAGDTVEVQVFHNHGANVDVSVGEFSGYRVSL